MHNLFRNVALIHRTSQITGTTATFNDAGIDASNYEGIAWVFAASANQTTGASVKAQECSSSGFSTGSDVADLTGTSIAMTTAIADGAVILDVYRPAKQWVRAAYVKTATSDVLDAIVALGYRPLEAPVTHSTADVIGAEYHVHPATGTA